MGKLELQQMVLGPVYTNCYFLKNKETGEALIVDPADSPNRIFQKVEDMGAKPVGILLTHGHFDHVTAMEELRRDLGVPVYACEQEQAVLADPDKNLSVQFQGGRPGTCSGWRGTRPYPDPPPGSRSSACRARPRFC